MPNPTNVPITPPRVPFLDPRSGMISREWYRFFLSLYQTTGESTVSLDDLQKGPPSLTIEDVINAVVNAPVDTPPTNEIALSLIDELTKRVLALESQPRVEPECEPSEVLAWLSPE